jgi:hypothetical protein
MMRDVICHSAGSPPSSPRPSHPPQWASDGREPALYDMTGFDHSLITEGRYYPKEQGFLGYNNIQLQIFV